MSRPKKKEISLNKESVLSLMQEIYNELVEQRATALRIQNKMLALMKDSSDMAIIGPIIKEQQKIINDTVEKKLTLSKLQSTVWEKSQQKNNEENFSMSDIDDYAIKQFKKTYKLPENADTNKLVSFMTSNGRLVIEIPLKNEEKSSSDLFPKISEDNKNISINLSLPECTDPTKINVTCKDRNLVVKYEDNTEKDNNFSKVKFVKSVLLPENSQFNSLNYEYKNNSIINHTTKLSNSIEQKKTIEKNIEDTKLLETQYEAYQLYTSAISRDGIPYDLISKALPTIEKEVNNIFLFSIDDFEGTN